MLRTCRLAVVMTLLTVGTTQWLAAPARAEGGGLDAVVGTGDAGSSGDGGPAVKALLNRPGGVAVAPDGTLYVSDTGNFTVRRVASDGTITTVAGSGRQGKAGTAVPDGAKGTEVDLVQPQNLAAGADGTVYIADVSLFRVFALAPDGRLTVLAGTGRRGSAGDGGPAAKAALGPPGGLAVAADGTVYIGDPGNQRVRAVSPAGVITTIAGNGGDQVTAAGGVATQVPVPFADSLAADGNGTLWVADARLLRRLRDGKLATVTLPDPAKGGMWATAEGSTWPPPGSPMNNITAVAVGREGVYALDEHQGLQRLDADQRLETVAGPQRSVTGPIAVSASGAVYLVDPTGNRVYVTRPGPAGALPGRKRSVPWWPFAIGAAVVIAVAGWFIVRRRSATH